MADQDVAKRPLRDQSSTRLLLALYTRELKTAFFLSLSAEPDVQIAATAANSAELLTYGRAFHPDVIVVEWELPGKDMSGVILQLSQLDSAPKIFIISKPSSYQSIGNISKAANIYLIDSAPEDFLTALRGQSPAPIDSNNISGENQYE